MLTHGLHRLLNRHWFALPALLVVFGALVVSQTADWPVEARLIEAGLLFDLAVLIPALYLWCYRKSGKSAALRALALSCGGVWAASHLVPLEHQVLLPWLTWLRYAAIGLLIYVEVRVLASVYFAVILGRKSPEMAAIELSNSLGIPAQFAQLLAKEAEFWRRVFAWPIKLVRSFRRK
ncbi:hypothetical protein [Pseudomarimonas arenosa]|uniref:ABC transporter permease n=1 Tax=Pseudomarimonas arenosa TaxID=2774145 RepID=A0AAW3ZLI4_9GAMM|nr:hypothetical protein [Pseudomarimonas arenosa]MBD8525775.1 hypothetical protein [Pseudomarimonas arenosa]